MLQTYVLTAAIIIILTVILWPARIKAIRRRGIDPGLFGLKVWPARLWFLVKGHSIIKQAYAQNKDAPYLLQGLSSDVLVLPPRYLQELRMLSGDKLSASEALVSEVFGQYSGVDIILDDRQGYDIARIQLTKSLPTLVPLLSAKVDEIISHAFKGRDMSQHVEVDTKQLVNELVLRTTLLTFVGPDLCDDAEVQWIITEFTNIVRDMAIMMLFIPQPLRRLLTPYLPPTARMRRLHRQARKFLLADRRKIKSSAFPTVLNHFLASPIDVSEEKVIAKFFVLIAGALHTTKSAMYHAIVDLSVLSGDCQALREEIQTVHVKESASPWHADELADLTKLDAFMKESQRVSPPNYLGFSRIATSTITLRDGSTIPKGTMISMPAGPMSKDPANYPDPDRFLADRFLAIKTTGTMSVDEKSKSLGKFIDTEATNLHWGHGRFTCPGRWYASAVMKLMLAQLIQRFDMKLPKGQSGRLPHVYLDLMIQPSPKQIVLFRKCTL